MRLLTALLMGMVLLAPAYSREDEEPNPKKPNPKNARKTKMQQTEFLIDSSFARALETKVNELPIVASTFLGGHLADGVDLSERRDGRMEGGKIGRGIYSVLGEGASRQLGRKTTRIRFTTLSTILEQLA